MTGRVADHCPLYTDIYRGQWADPATDPPPVVLDAANETEKNFTWSLF